jgi:hypothetical protein
MAIDVATLKNDPVAFAKHRDGEMARRAEFAKLFPNEAAAVDATIINQLPGGVAPQEVILNIQGRNEEEDEKLAEVRKVHRRMAEVGTIPATIVWMHPWPGQGDGRYLMYDDMKIEACPIGQTYITKVIRHYKVDLEDKGGRFGADVITPIALANDLHAQFEKLRRGGCCRYMGDHLPGEAPKTRDEELKMVNKAKAEQVRYYRQLFREAEGFFQQPARHGLRNITENHRLAATWLTHYHYLPLIPAWVTASREEGDIPESCARCGKDVSEAGFACGDCGYIIDPARAYRANEIEEEHHSLRRLTRDQLDELGLQHVQTAEEYRAGRRETPKNGHDAEPIARRRRGPNRRARRQSKPPVEQTVETPKEAE